MRALLVHNPYSRKRLKTKEIDYIKKELSVEYTTDIFETMGRGSIKEYVSNHAKNYDLVIAAGGDGTIHEAAIGILNSEKKPTLAIIPRGTMNDVARLTDRLLVLNGSHLAMDGAPSEVFTRAQELLDMGLDIPDITRVFLRLQQMGLPLEPVYTIDQALDAVKKLKEGM